MMIVVVVSKYNTRRLYYTTLAILTITLQLLLCTVLLLLLLLLLCNHNHYSFQVVDGFGTTNLLRDDFSFRRRRGRRLRRRRRRVEDINRSISITRMILLHDQRTTTIWTMNNNADHGGWRIEREDSEQHDVQSSSSCSSSSRRDVFQRCIPPSILLWFGCGAASSAATASTAAATTASKADVQQQSILLPLENSDDPLIDVYFGCGCFWHVQYEMVEAERSFLGRTNDLDLSSRAAYAGGKENPGKQQQVVCYHNSVNTNINEDYSTLGHAEVVSLTIPRSSFGNFASVYCKLFRNGMRPDQFGDRGRQYRNIVGIPGGVNSKQLVQQLLEASRQAGDQLDFAEGGGRGRSKNSNGDDEDIPRLVWIIDSSKFLSHKAEAYHQFHDGFYFGEKYGREYNSITKRLVEENGEDDFGPSCPTSS